MLARLKALVPEPFVGAYHYALARLSSAWYGHPSRELIVIGVTGTNGKTTTSYYAARALEASGLAAGCTTTAVLKIGPQEWINPTKMTMPGRFWIQRMLRRMVDAGCRYAVVETSSQGLIQHRHIGIEYDVAVFTNLTPEHIEAHGGFDNYKKAKRVLFEHLSRTRDKTIAGKRIPKTAIVNADSTYADYYASTPGLKRVLRFAIDADADVRGTDVELGDRGSSFSVDGVRVCLNQPGRYNVSNALAALAICRSLDVDVAKAAGNLANIERVPGRFDRVEAGQPWTVIVDYAPEPESFRQLYEALSTVPRKKTIHVLGSCGGGRDVSRRPVLGKLAAERADIVIVTNEDPYDDDPMQIIEQVAAGAEDAGRVRGKDLFIVEDRALALRKAMELAAPGDLVVITGKGCEPWICVAGGKKLPWDEIQAAKDAIAYVSRR